MQFYARALSVMRIKMKIVLLTITSIVIIITSLNMMDLPIELRFDNTKYNYLSVSILSVALPLSIFFSALTFKGPKRILGVATSFTLSFPCALVLFFASDDFKSISKEGVDHSFEKIRELEAKGSKYRLYRTNGGATTSFGLVLRKETPLITGINTVNVLFSKYKAEDSSLTLTNDNTIELRIEPYGKSDKLEVVTLSI